MKQFILIVTLLNSLMLFFAASGNYSVYNLMTRKEGSFLRYPYLNKSSGYSSNYKDIIVQEINAATKTHSQEEKSFKAKIKKILKENYPAFEDSFTEKLILNIKNGVLEYNSWNMPNQLYIVATKEQTPTICNVVKKIAEKFKTPPPLIILCNDKSGLIRPPASLILIGKGNSYNAYILELSSTLMQAWNKEETESVIAHEFAHLQLNHIEKLDNLLQQLDNTFLPIPNFIKNLIYNWYSRKYEKEADLTAATVINPQALVQAFKKNEPYETNVLRIMGFHDSWLNRMFWSHPSIPQRIAYLQAMPHPLTNTLD